MVKVKVEIDVDMRTSADCSLHRDHVLDFLEYQPCIRNCYDDYERMIDRQESIELGLVLGLGACNN